MSGARFELQMPGQTVEITEPKRESSQVKVKVRYSLHPFNRFHFQQTRRVLLAKMSADAVVSAPTVKPFASLFIIQSVE